MLHVSLSKGTVVPTSRSLLNQCCLSACPETKVFNYFYFKEYYGTYSQLHSVAFVSSMNSALPSSWVDPPPPGNTSHMGFYLEYKQLDPPGKSWDPPPPWKMLDPRWNLGK